MLGDALWLVDGLYYTHTPESMKDREAANNPPSRNLAARKARTHPRSRSSPRGPAGGGTPARRLSAGCHAHMDMDV